MSDPTPADHLRPVREYGCTWCSRRNLPCWHREGLDAEYTDHIVYQGRHTFAERPPTAAEQFRRLVEGDPV